jgi:hypothetical protein
MNPSGAGKKTYGWCSIQLSLRRLEAGVGIEPAWTALQAAALLYKSYGYRLIHPDNRPYPPAACLRLNIDTDFCIILS